MEKNETAAESLDLTLMRMMRRCGHILYHRYSSNYSQNKILLLLKQKGNMNQRALCDELCIQAGSLSEILCKLECAGYIEKSRCSSDKRNLILHLTPEGVRKAECFEAQREELAQKLFVSLSREEKTLLLATLTCLSEKWESACCCDRSCGDGKIDMNGKGDTSC